MTVKVHNQAKINTLDWATINGEASTATLQALGDKYGVSLWTIARGLKKYRQKLTGNTSDLQFEYDRLLAENKALKIQRTQLQNELNRLQGKVALANKPVEEIPLEKIVKKDDRVNQPLDPTHYGKCKCGEDWLLRQNSKTGELFKACPDRDNCGRTGHLKKSERRRLGLDQSESDSPEILTPEPIVEKHEPTQAELNELERAFAEIRSSR